MKEFVSVVPATWCLILPSQACKIELNFVKWIYEKPFQMKLCAPEVDRREYTM